MMIYSELGRTSLSNHYLLLAEKQAGKSGKGEKNGHHQSGAKKNLFKSPTHEVPAGRVVTSKSGAKTSLRTLEQNSCYEKEAQDNLNVRKDLGHCVYETIIT